MKKSEIRNENVKMSDEDRKEKLQEVNKDKRFSMLQPMMGTTPVMNDKSFLKVGGA